LFWRYKFIMPNSYIKLANPHFFNLWFLYLLFFLLRLCTITLETRISILHCPGSSKPCWKAWW
jgi:hypothetical protein